MIYLIRQQFRWDCEFAKSAFDLDIEKVRTIILMSVSVSVFGYLNGFKCRYPE